MSAEFPLERTFLRVIAISIFLASVSIDSCVSSPIDTPDMMRLGSLKVNGDLKLSFHICTLRLDESADLEIVFEQEMEALDFERSYSHFNLLPFESGVFWQTPEKPIWLTLGRRLLLFSVDTAMTTAQTLAERDRILNQLGSTVGEPGTAYRCGSVLLIADLAGEWAMVEDEKWMFLYRNGALASFCTPGGTRFGATANGERIISVTKGFENIAIVKARRVQQPHFYSL